jgi:P-type Cu+ transporter
VSCCDPAAERLGDRGSETLPLWRVVVAAMLAGQSMLLSLTLNVAAMKPNERAFFVVFLVGLVVATFELVGAPLWASVRTALTQRKARFELLFATAIAGALSLSITSVVRGAGDVYFDVVIILLALHAVGHRVNGVERRRSLAAMRELRQDDAECTVRRCCGSTERVRVADVKAGQTIVVIPGERVGLDGVVGEGEAFVREAPLTGEPFEVVKRPGDPVLAGSVVVDAMLFVRVSAPHGHRMVDRIASAVEDALALPARAERAADRVARWLLPAVVTTAAVVFAGWGAARGFEQGAVNAMAVLLVACPCAMGFAIPLTLSGALGALARRGIFLRGGDALERLARVDVAALDKTGTLTRSDARLVDSAFDAAAPYDAVSLRELLATVERASRHPLASAFEELATPSGRFVVETFHTLPAVGVEACVVDTREGARLRVAIGTTALVLPEESPKLATLASRLRAADGAHRIAATLDGHLVGLVAVREQPRDGSLGLVSGLERLGLRVILLTGDRDRGRSAPFASLEVAHGLTPAEKAARVEALVTSGHAVLFVGDGVNDGAAMAASHVALAPEDGTALARDVAHGVFRGSSIHHLVEAIEVSRAAVASMRASLLYAVIYNAAGMTLAAAGLVHPVLAAVLMVSSSLFVTFRASAFVSGLAPKNERSRATSVEPMRAARAERRA